MATASSRAVGRLAELQVRVEVGRRERQQAAAQGLDKLDGAVVRRAGGPSVVAVGV
jgi:hypothetical protein